MLSCYLEIPFRGLEIRKTSCVLCSSCPWTLTTSLWHTLILHNKWLQALVRPCGSHRNVAAEVEAKRRHQVEGEVDDEAEVEDAKHAHYEVRPPLAADAGLQEGDDEPQVDGND